MASGRERSSTKLTDISYSNKGIKRILEKEQWTDRGGWWKKTVKDTPNPGSYHVRDFIEEASLNPVRMTYGFKGTGRNAQIACVRNGAMLLPGAYIFTDCTQEALQRQASYSFKNCPRPDNYTLGIRDKDIDLSPCHYNVTEKPVPKIPCKHVMFRSAVDRLIFLPWHVRTCWWKCEHGGQLSDTDGGVRVLSYPVGVIRKEGPPPGHYTPQSTPANGITSCFKSAVPRLHSVRSRTPGPGTYEPSWKTGSWLAKEANMGHFCGLFFRNTF